MNETELNKKLQGLEQRICEFEKQMGGVDDKVTQILDAISGNPITKQGGITRSIYLLDNQVKHLEQRIQKQEYYVQRVMWITGFVITMIFSLEYFIKLYNTINTAGVQ